MTSSKFGVVGAVAGAAISLVLVGFHIISLVLGAALGWALLTFIGKERAPSTKSMRKHQAEPFHPDFVARTIAYEAATRKLWTRPTRGPARIWDLGDIKSWDHTWTVLTNAWGKEFRKKSVIRFTTRDMSRPAFEIKMDNYEEASEWHARLTHWKNG